jgi:hypothetical protein
MIVAQRRKLIMFCALLSCMGISSSASSRVWNATPLQIAADYSSIFHNKGNNDLVSITWFATPMMPAGSQLYPICQIRLYECFGNDGRSAFKSRKHSGCEGIL